MSQANRIDVVLFALESSRDFGKKVARSLSMTLSDHEERDFDDGEHKTRPLVNVRGRDVFVIHSLYSDSQATVNDKLCQLLFFLGALKGASADRVTAVVPYLCYARKDRQTKPRDPVTTRYVAEMFEAVGVDRVVTVDVHNLAAFQNAFAVQTDHLEARPLFIKHFTKRLGSGEVVVVSPDAGGTKRAEAFRDSLEAASGRSIPTVFLEKRRSEGVVSGEAVVGNVAGKTAVIIDDLISTGTTLARAAEACVQRGARKVYAAATHGIFVGDANRVLCEPALEKVVVTNTIPPFRLDPQVVERELVVLDIAPLVAEAIKRIHEGGSLVQLLED